MKEPREEDERLSALLEGRMDGQQREELLAHIAASGDDYEVFTDTAAVLRALEEEDAAAAQPPVLAAQPAPEPVVIPLRPRRRGWRTPAGRLAIAATIIGVVASSSLLLRDRMSVTEGPVQLALRADTSAQGLPPGWRENRAWTSNRGESVAGRQVRAAQIGALLVDLSVAVRARDTAEIQELAAQVRTRFEPEATGATPLRQIHARAGEPPELLAPLLERATERLAARTDSDWLELGAWVEAAGLAAAQQNDAFFRDRESKAMLRQADHLTRDQAAAQAAIAGIRTAWPAEGTPQWGPLQGALRSLLGAIATDEESIVAPAEQ